MTEWQLGRVKRVALRQTKSGFEGTVTTFLTGIANPLPIVTSSDGGILVGDWRTGTIYSVSADRG